MTFIQTLQTLLCVLGIALGQIFFKKAALELPAGSNLLDMALNRWLLVALIIYGLATLAWVHILRSAPLAYAYPLFALAFVIVPVLAHLVFGDPLRWPSFVGGMLILLGVFIAARDAAA